MSYAPATATIEPRSAVMLDKGGSPSPYDTVAPGLYPGEALFEIVGAGLVAVSVETMRLENGAGIAIHGCARAINDDGSSKVDPHGQQIETAFVSSFDWGFVSARGSGDAVAGQRVLEREMALAVMGEPGGTLAADLVLDLPERPILECDRTSVNIVQAVTAAANAGIGDVGSLLGG